MAHDLSSSNTTCTYHVCFYLLDLFVGTYLWWKQWNWTPQQQITRGHELIIVCYNSAVDKVWSILPALELLPLDSTPMQAKWIKLDLTPQLQNNCDWWFIFQWKYLGICECLREMVMVTHRALWPSQWISQFCLINSCVYNCIHSCWT